MVNSTMKPMNKTASDLFDLLRTRFSPLNIGNDNADSTVDPAEARFFSFVYTENDKPLGPVSVSIVGNDQIKVFYSDNIVQNSKNDAKWYGFLKDMRNFAKQNLMTFDAHDIEKNQLDDRDYKVLSKNNGAYKEDEVEITESKMYGSKRKSMQKFENATLVVYHKKTVDEEVRGSRSRHIDKIFIESDGEKFRFPINYLNGARAMAVHVNEGGKPYDEIGKHIISTVEEMRNLSQFARITRRHAMEDEEANSIRSRVVDSYQAIRKDIMRMQNVNNYKQFVETFSPVESSAAGDVSQLQEKFTVKVWNEKMDNLLPSVQRALESTTNKVEASMGAPDYNPAAGQYASNREYGMFSKEGNNEVAEIIDDIERAYKANVFSSPEEAIDSAMKALTNLSDTESKFEEADDTDVRDQVARDLEMRIGRDSGVDEDKKSDAEKEREIKRARYAADEPERGEDRKKVSLKKAPWEESVTEENEEKCKYCGGDCPNDEDHACDGYLGDIDGLYEASPSVEKTIKDPNFVLILKKDDSADAMFKNANFTKSQGLLAFIMADIASRAIGANADALANFASEMSINIGEEGETFGTRMTPEYKGDKQLAMLLAKKYLDDFKMMATDQDYKSQVRVDPTEMYGKKKKRSGGYHEEFENWANEMVEAVTQGTIGTQSTQKANAQVLKALSGGDAKAAQDMKRVSDKLTKGQRLAPNEIPVAGEIAKRALTTKKPQAAIQALANSETNTTEDGEVAILEKTLKVKANQDYDGDGRIESPRDEYMGSRDKAIKKATKKKSTAEEINDSEDDTLFQESLNLIKIYAGI